jgi:hypothetical protein
MTHYHEGQEVEVAMVEMIGVLGGLRWRKAKIIKAACQQDKWLVEFPDGTRAIYDVDHIREATQGA